MFKKLCLFCLFAFSRIYAQEESPKESFQEIKYVEHFPAFSRLPDFTVYRVKEYVYSDLYYQVINYLIDKNLNY